MPPSLTSVEVINPATGGETGVDGGPRFFRVLTPATFLFMCGTSTNGFCPLKFPVPVLAAAPKTAGDARSQVD